MVKHVYHILFITNKRTYQNAALRTNPLPPAAATGHIPNSHTTRTVRLTVRYANVRLFCGNLAMFRTHARTHARARTHTHQLRAQTRCTAVRFPKHRSCHGTSPRKHYATELPCSGRDKRDTRDIYIYIYIYTHIHTHTHTHTKTHTHAHTHKHTRTQTV